ncbi:MAG: TlyA family RNA methyltransferase [Clostridia bacterium]|nr:TlyA family RNA methyltransferase [Clostridia bacterium]
MRADVYLTEQGYAPSRQRARTLIEGGRVTVDGVTLTKPAQSIGEGAHEVTVLDDLPYVGRGGLKLEAALDAFAIKASGLTALDIGASTGGFTDCLLQRGAAHVYAVDSGSGQLAKRLLEDPRVTSMERTNARTLTSAQIGGTYVDLIVMDVSFISATYILPQFPDLLTLGGRAVCLIKPQFEVGRSMLGKGGVVKDPKAHRYAIDRVLSCARSVGLTPTGLIASPVTGGDGNREFLVCLVKDETAEDKLSEQMVTSVIRNR